MRAVRAAECVALAALCERELREEHRVEAGLLSQLVQRAEAGERWIDEAEPVIGHPHFTGTGTRFLEDNGQDAITGLFQRSFA